MEEKFSKRVENTVEKGDIGRYAQCFKKNLYRRHVKRAFMAKGLTLYQTTKWWTCPN